jgi:hypothetical protein
MRKTAEYRRERIEKVALLTQKLDELEKLLSVEEDEQKRKHYEAERTMLMEAIRKS